MTETGYALRIVRGSGTALLDHQVVVDEEHHTITMSGNGNQDDAIYRAFRLGQRHHIKRSLVGVPLVGDVE